MYRILYGTSTQSIRRSVAWDAVGSCLLALGVSVRLGGNLIFLVTSSTRVALAGPRSFTGDSNLGSRVGSVVGPSSGRSDSRRVDVGWESLVDRGIWFDLDFHLGYFVE
jgi:hypothetical protein